MIHEQEKNYAEMSADELDQFVGTLLLSGSMGGQPATPEFKRTLAKNWFSHNVLHFRKAVCNSPLIQEQLIATHSRDRNLLITAIADLIGVTHGLIPGAAVAAMIVHYGLDSLCSDKSQ